MKKKIFFLVLATILIFYNFSCQRENVINNNKYLFDLNTIISKKPIYYSELFSDYQIIPLETTENSVIGYIDDIKILNDTFYILSRQAKSVSIFLRNGKFISTIRKVGKGPGEYINPVSFEISNSHISILDLSYPKLNYFNENGTFLHYIKFNTRFQDFVTDGKYTYLYKTPRQELVDSKNNKILYTYNNKGKKLDEQIELSQLKFITTPYEILRGGNFFKSINDIKFYPQGCETIFSVKNKKVQPLFSLKFPNNTNLKNSIKGSSVPTKGSLQNLINYSISEYSDNRDLAYFKVRRGIKTFCHIFINLNSGNSICSTRIIDDITFLSPYLFKINDKFMIGIIDNFPDKIKQIKNNVQLNKTKLTLAEKTKILKLSDECNPIIVLYRLRN